MSWQSLLKAQKVKTYQTSRQELDDLRDLIERDLQDAAVDSISSDRRFATAYNAALQSCKMAIACAGYRVTGPAHHLTTFDAIEIAMGQSVSELAAYFDTCRRKRNQVDYDRANAATESEVEDLLTKAEEFRELVEKWIRKQHSEYAVERSRDDNRPQDGA